MALLRYHYTQLNRIPHSGEFFILLFYLKPSFLAVLGIRIRRIRMFLGLQDPDPDPLVRGPDPVSDPSLFSSRCSNACKIGF
jgi:hypothetical protein